MNIEYKKNKTIKVLSILCLILLFVFVIDLLLGFGTAFAEGVDGSDGWFKYGFIKYFVYVTIWLYPITSIILFSKLPKKHKLIQVGNILVLIAFYILQVIILLINIPLLSFVIEGILLLFMASLLLIYPVFKYCYFIAVYTDKLKNNNQN